MEVITKTVKLLTVHQGHLVPHSWLLIDPVLCRVTRGLIMYITEEAVNVKCLIFYVCILTRLKLIKI